MVVGSDDRVVINSSDFNSLSENHPIFATTNNDNTATVIKDAGNNNTLAVLLGIDSSLIDSNDFVAI